MKHHAAILLLALACLVACREDRLDQPRRYTEVIQTAPAPTPKAAMAAGALPPGHPEIPDRTPQLPDAPPVQLVWTPLEGWTVGPDMPGRLATFRVGSSEIALSALGGGGTLESNIARWGTQQLGLSDLSKVETTRFDVPAGPMTLVDLSPASAAAGADKSMVVGILDQGEVKVFVRMSGPLAEVQEQRGALREFCASLRHPEAP